MNTISIIMTIFNKENILEKILSGLFEMTSKNVLEYIFILDGCKDKSESILQKCIDKIDISYKILYTDDVFEIKANNAGLKECKGKYAIIVQDDMLIMEKDWDQRLMEPLLKFNDIWAVTARTSCSLNINKKFYNIKEGPVGHLYCKKTDYSRNVVYVGQIINRGPLMMKMSVIKKLGYLDETLPGIIGLDDVDLCLKAYKLYSLRCCQYWISYYSPLEWGSSRVGPNITFITKEHTKNMNEVISRYYDILKNWDNDELRYIN